ncbi:hypothetical protein QBC47DRAFT_445833 [Echria macrotheca]|uniref:Uncharacterized protein n=1 Tax=Echria macrotheca TaxID=438768 RepID=A0AAJ0F5E0_9PEZI|nr:hypothetical protein QBC47DRAFT_445833 [Echria macrotheca]
MTSPWPSPRGEEFRYRDHRDRDRDRSRDRSRDRRDSNYYRPPRRAQSSSAIKNFILDIRDGIVSEILLIPTTTIRSLLETCVLATIAVNFRGHGFGVIVSILSAAVVNWIYRTMFRVVLLMYILMCGIAIFLGPRAIEAIAGPRPEDGEARVFDAPVFNTPQQPWSF